MLFVDISKTRDERLPQRKGEAQMNKWKCGVCGYIHDGDEPPAQCPKCGASAVKFTLLDVKAANLVE